MRLFPLTLFCLACATLNGYSANGDLDEDYQILPVGAEEVINLEFVPDEKTLESYVLSLRQGFHPNQLKLRAEKPGKSAIVVRNKEGTLLKKMKYHVLSVVQYQRLGNVRRLLKGVKGIEVKFEGDNIVVDGAASAKEIERIEKLKPSYPEILNLAVAH